MIRYRKSKKQLRHLRHKYLFVDKRIFYQERSDVHPVSRRDVTAQDASPCPYTTEETPINFNQIPSSLVEAVCPGCPHTCHPITATVYVLVRKRKDQKTGDKVYGLQQRSIKVGYTYDPSKKPEE